MKLYFMLGAVTFQIHRDLITKIPEIFWVPLESVYCLHFIFSVPEAQDSYREKQQLCHPTRLCNQPYH